MQFQKNSRIAQSQRERDSAVRISKHTNVTLSTDKQVICAIDNDNIFRQPREGPAHWSHEEADSGMMVHTADAGNTYTSILTHTLDNNVAVLAVYAFGELTSSLN